MAGTPADVATVHLLDVGPQQYGDALLCVFKNETVLIDGAHPGNYKEVDGHPAIQDQVGAILGQDPKQLHVSLLMVSHAHDDHIGCLPALVEKGWLSAEWAVVNDPGTGFGRTASDAQTDAALDDRTRQVVAALREEPRSPNLTDAALAEFLSDAAGIEQRYIDMLNTLEKRGTQVVRFGTSPAALQTKLIKRFSEIGLELLGPSKAHLAVCAENVLSKRDAAIRLVSGVQRDDVAASPAGIYRQLMRGTSDAPRDAVDEARSGNFVNLQSIVATFKVGAKRFFFAGDMQFIDPGTTDQTIANELERLRGAIAERAPFAFFKLCHHGSKNGFNDDFLKQIGGTHYLGICAGSGSTKHPNPETLSLLKQHGDELTWARTDHNGRCTFHFRPQRTAVEVERGELNDGVPNKEVDVAPAPPPPPPLAVAPATVERVEDGRTVEIIARIPHVRTRVTISVEIDPAAAAVELKTADEGAGSDFAVAPAVRDLLIATNAKRLAQNIGDGQAQRILEALRSGGATLVDVPGDAAAAEASEPVRAALKNAPRTKGVLILGGHDVVPSQSVDSLPPSLRSRVGTSGDPDNFIVWNDEIYGDIDGDRLPELPVSRIPDGHSAGLLVSALSGRASAGVNCAGVRNIARPFADDVFRRLADGGGMLTSEPHAFSSLPAKLDGDRLYLMLHGDYGDGSRFWGEEPNGYVEAVNLSNVPDSTRAVIFSGCCWGALTVDRPAGRLSPGQPVTMKRTDTSLALAFLKNGARAFVGCTGAHYSPDQPPYGYYGGPMHDAFWKRIREGAVPAQALFDAKQEYFRGMPHGQTKPSSAAIEFKIWRQYTCLGLGW